MQVDAKLPGLRGDPQILGQLSTLGFRWSSGAAERRRAVTAAFEAFWLMAGRPADHKESCRHTWMLALAFFEQREKASGQ